MTTPSEAVPLKTNPLKVAMLTYSFYESDPRVRRYAETLVKTGNSVDVISLGHEGQEACSEVNGVTVYHIQRRTIDEKGKFDYLFRILKFFLKSAVFVTRKHFSRGYDIVHVHSLPDFEVFAALIPRLFGAKIILDIHDPVPDFFSAKFGYGSNGIYFKILKEIEKYSSRFADHVITVTDYWRDVIKKRSGIPDAKISAIVNFPDIKLFHAGSLKTAQLPSRNGEFKILYPGTLNRHCGLDLIITAVSMLQTEIPEIRLQVYGKGSELANLRSLVSRLNLEHAVFFHGPVPIQEVPELMRNADIGIALLSGNHNYSRQALNVKLFEFLAMGLPAIATKTESILHYLGTGVVMLSNPNDPQDIARCIRELYRHPEKREALREAGMEYIRKNNWQSQIHVYGSIMNRILQPRTPENETRQQ
jgi:glycosyltransferase involved in cell wall biosynthesis